VTKTNITTQRADNWRTWWLAATALYLLRRLFQQEYVLFLYQFFSAEKRETLSKMTDHLKLRGHGEKPWPV
jgi:hypothetical protein